MEPWSALKMMCHEAAHKHTHTHSQLFLCAFVYVTVSFIHIVSVNYYFTVECFLIMMEPGCTEAVFSFRFVPYISLWKTIIKIE